MTEMNVCWRNLPITHQLHGRTDGWFEARQLSISYFRSDAHATPHQVGGTCTLTVNQAAHRVHSSGSDLSGLGRWSWTRLQGRRGIFLRVISAYRPVFNPSGSLSVYNQHRRFFYNNNDDRCPRQAFLEDLSAEIQTWLDLGDQLMIALDLNEDIRSSTIQSLFASLGLTELLTHRHGRNAPPTYNRGTAPIDAIFVTATLLECRCGYFAFGAAVPSDHRALWVDIPTPLPLVNLARKFHAHRPGD